MEAVLKCFSFQRRTYVCNCIMSTAAVTCVIVRFDTSIHSDFLTKPQLFLLLVDLFPTVFLICFSASPAFLITKYSSLGERDFYCVAECIMLPWQESRHFVMLKLHLFLEAAGLHGAHVHYVRRTSMYRGEGLESIGFSER